MNVDEVASIARETAEKVRELLNQKDKILALGGGIIGD